MSRFLQGAFWVDASRIYKIIVEKWRNENPNQSPEFLLDVGGLSVAVPTTNPSDENTTSSGGSPKLIRRTTTTEVAITSLKRIPPAHIRVRDKLVGILSASGLRIGLPSSVSLVFSKSDLGSNASSTERICASSQEVASTMSLPDPSQSGITDSFPRVFKEFDFLEAEHDSVSETADSCFGWLSTMRPTREKDDERASEKNLSMSGKEEEEPEEDEESESHEEENSESDDRTTTGGRRIEDDEELEEYDDEEERTPCQSECDDDREEVEMRMRQDIEQYTRVGSVAASSLAEDDYRSRLTGNLVSISSQLT